MATRWKNPSPTIDRVVEILRQQVEKSGRSHRAIEVQARWPQGTLSLLLAHRSPVTLDQLEALAGILGFRVLDVLLDVYGPRFENNPAGRVLRSVARKHPYLVGLLFGELT